VKMQQSVRRLTRFAVGRLAVGAMCALTVTAARPVERVPGITFEVVTTTVVDSPMPMPAMPTITATGSATTAGGFRMDIVAGSAPGMYDVGDYFVTKDGRSLLVHPASKTYVDVVDMAMGQMSALPAEILAQMHPEAIKGSTEKVPGNEIVDGRPTQHFRTTLGYTMNMMGQNITTTSTTDYWVATLPVRFKNPMVGAVPDAPTGPMAEVMKKALELAPPFGDGTPIKTVVATRADLGGNAFVTTITSEFKNIKEGDVDASRFQIPADYTRALK